MFFRQTLADLVNYFENDVALFNLYHISILCYEDIFTNKKVFMVDKNIFLLFAEF